MSAASSINRALISAVLTHRATVYSRTAGTGPFNLIVKSGLACRLEKATVRPGATSAERRDLANVGSLRFDADYDMPETGIQLEVSAFPGQRWNPISGTGWPDDAPGIGVIGKTIDVVRAS